MAAQEALRWRYGGDVDDDGNFVMRGRGRGVAVLVALLGALVCFVAVCLYLRWTCHRYNYNGRRLAASASFPVTEGLDDAAIAGLAVTTLYRPGSGGGAAPQQLQLQLQCCCSICLGEFQEGDKVKALPRCGHGFHRECVDAWLRARASCPLCRDTLLAARADDEAVGTQAV